jgi:GT2 family glycosyltransferase
VPDATVAIVTRNRCNELRRALASATVQEGSVEVLVLDDGSEDATPEIVRDEFPQVRFVRFEQRAGLVVRRNDAGQLATGGVIVSLDDDALFSSPRSVAQTLRDFDHPRIAAVAIPYEDVRNGRVISSLRAATPPDRSVVPTFRGTAYAVRRDVFRAIGGFRQEIVHQGEEADFCLRLLSAGYVVRLGRADEIIHHSSASRDLERMDIYGQRNVLLWSFTFFPFPLGAVMMFGYAARAVLWGVRVGRPISMMRGVGYGLGACWALRSGRRPLSWKLALLDRRVRRAGLLPLEDVEKMLPNPLLG